MFRPWAEPLEDRTLLSAVQPIKLVTPSLAGVSGDHSSAYPSLSANGQLVAFTS
jgi:hypothetical protein